MKLRFVLALSTVMSSQLSSQNLGPSSLADYWGPIQNIRASDGGYQVVPLHLARLCDGRTLLMGFDRGRPSGYYQSFTAMVAPQTMPQVIANPATPVTHTLRKMPVPLDLPFNPANPATHDVNICGGSAFTEQGDLKVGGISRYPITPAGTFIIGTPYSIRLNATGTTWTRLPNEFVGRGEGLDEAGWNWRWYPTFTQIASPLLRVTPILIVGGSTVVDVHKVLPPLQGPPKFYWPNDSIEIDDHSGTNRLVVAHNQSHPDIRNSSGYPHVIRQPDGTQLIHGESGRPVKLAVAGAMLIPGLSRRPGPPEVEHPSDASSTSPLPIYWNNNGPYPNGSFVVCGGKPGTAYESSFDVYNAGTGEWRHFDLGIKRSWCTTKLLADGTVAIIGGVGSDGSGGQGRTQVFDPATNTIRAGISEMATQRGYHTTAILQNDGSIFVCAGWPGPFNENDVTESMESANCQTYWPDYVWKAKPYILSIPATVRLGATFVVDYYDGYNLRPIVDARLTALPTDTHGFDSSQSNIQLRVVSSVPVAGKPNQHRVTLQMPQSASGAADTAHVVPPGCYSLFLIDDQKVPSQAAPGLNPRIKVTW